ncbi:hypothetical protein M0R45_025608 [Rubus argutus]|uniref:Uncharacterized protein n=1 Tax=Rubus argutus TaxID=59490 RepID=A0AAW1WUH9_RUBAR
MTQKFETVERKGEEKEKENSGYICGYFVDGPDIGPVPYYRAISLLFRSLPIFRMAFLVAAAAYILEAAYERYLAKRVDQRMVLAELALGIFSLCFVSKKALKYGMRSLIMYACRLQCTYNCKI